MPRFFDRGEGVRSDRAISIWAANPAGRSGESRARPGAGVLEAIRKLTMDSAMQILPGSKATPRVHEARQRGEGEAAGRVPKGWLRRAPLGRPKTQSSERLAPRRQRSSRAKDASQWP